MMYHFIYKTTCSSGKYYIGRHSTEKLNDGYFGSGKWIRSLKDTSSLSREIIQFCDSIEQLKNTETKFLKENVGKENCMNFCTNSEGFDFGDLNIARSEKERKRKSEFFKGENNPTKREEVRKKISESNKGKVPHNKGKTASEEDRKKISEGRTGCKITEEGREKLSISRKKQYLNGERTLPTFAGKTHSTETLNKMSNSHKNREKKECLYCKKIVAVNVYSRCHGENCKEKHIHENSFYQREHDEI